MTQDAIFRNIEIIGEAVKQLSSEKKASRPDVPWKDIAGMRHRLIHQYFQIRLDRVWSVVQEDLSPLQDAVAALLAELELPTAP